jgi:DNA repair protein RadC
VTRISGISYDAVHLHYHAQINVRVLNHLIVASDDVFSFAEKGLL